MDNEYKLTARGAKEGAFDFCSLGYFTSEN